MDLEDLKQAIIKNINTANLPVDSVYYLMQSLTNELAIAYQQYVQSKNAAAAVQESQPTSAEKKD